jgi:hypothetical protein
MDDGTVKEIETVDGYSICAPFNESFYLYDIHGKGWGFNWAHVKWIEHDPPGDGKAISHAL